MEIHEIIKEARKKAGLTQSQLGSAIGKNQQTIAKYESGVRKPKSDILGKIAIALSDNDEDAAKLLLKMSNSYLKDDEKLSELEPSFSIKSDDDLNLLSENDKDIVLLHHFLKLNEIGKDIAIEQVQTLTKFSELTKK